MADPFPHSGNSHLYWQRHEEDSLVKKISLRKRFEVLKRCKFACAYCGTRPPEATLEIDHIVAVANGGDNSSENLTTACDLCNRGKSDIPLEVLVFIAEKKHIAAGLSEVEYKTSLAAAKAERHRISDGMRELPRRFNSAVGKAYIPDSYHDAIHEFLVALPSDVVFSAMDAAIADGIGHPGGTFSHFRKLCRAEIKGRLS